LRYAFPGLADSPWATRCRPLRGLRRRGVAPLALRIPRARGLALGYTLSPRCAGLRRCGLAGLGLRRCRPLRGLAPFALNISIAHLPSLGYHQVAITKAPTGDFDSHLSFVVEPSK